MTEERFNEVWSAARSEADHELLPDRLHEEWLMLVTEKFLKKVFVTDAPAIREPRQVHKWEYSVLNGNMLIDLCCPSCEKPITGVIVKYELEQRKHGSLHGAFSCPTDGCETHFSIDRPHPKDLAQVFAL